MDGTFTDLELTLEEARKTQEELDKRIFYLKTLFETSRELSGFIQPKKIMETFLLMTMGSVGITHGLAALINTRTHEGHITSRGIEDSEKERFQSNISQICNQYFSQEKIATVSIPRAKIITHNEFLYHSFLPERTKILIMWTIDKDYSGLLGLGEKISGQLLDEDDLDILLNLVNILISALSHALSAMNIQQLNSDLHRKNTELQEALDQARQARKDADRRVFHLKTLYDLASELSPLIQMEKLLEAFLLMTMGTFGVSEGCVLLYDRETKTVRMAARGGETKGEVDGEVAEALLYKCFDASENRSLAPLSVSIITDPDVLTDESIWGKNITSGFMFVVDHSLLGLIVLGPTISRDPLSEEDKQLLCTHASSFMVFLKNARSFETIQTLNEDLSRSNKELRQTIAELTEARDRITVLEKAKAHIKTLVYREMERVGRPSLLDFVLILLTSILIGVLFNLSSPHGIPLLPPSLFRPSPALVDAVKTRGLIEEDNAVLVDARPQQFYDQKHIPHAVNVPLALFDIVYMMKLSHMDLDKPIIVYGRNISKHYDEEVVYRLKQRDHENVMLLSGGLSAWEKQGFPVEP